MSAMRVMIVEDEALVSEFLQMILEDAPCEVVGVAETGDEALSMAGARNPDLALVDIGLPGSMNGLELAERLREALPSIRVVFCSGSHEPITRAKAEALSPAGFLKKPFLPHHLIKLIEDLQQDD
jgi:DNA-binding NarL/FixJ family response regulator